MRFCIIFGAVLWKFILKPAVLRFYKTKRFSKFSKCSAQFSVDCDQKLGF